MTETVENNAQLVPSESASMMRSMLDAAKDIDVVKLEKLMDLQERLLNREAKEAFASDYVRMRPHLPKVIRTKENTQTKSKYAPLENINEIIDPILEQYGFGTSTKIVSQTETTVTVKAELWHKGGHIEETTVTMPIDNKGMQGTVNKTGPHAISSSITYIKRVAICALVNISTGDDKDGNKDWALPVTEENASAIVKLIEETKSDKIKFLKMMGVEKIEDIKSGDYAKAINALMTKKKKVETA